MIKLKRLLTEDTVDATELEKFDGNPDGILQYLHSVGKEDAELIDLGGEKYIIFDDNIINPDWPDVKDKTNWLYDSSAWRLREAFTDKIEEKFNKNFWFRPEILYHGTPKENVELIDREGLKMRHMSRGLSNKHITRAVFTSQSPEYAEYYYGPFVFEINTIQMKQDGFMPVVTKEPNHIESDVINFLAHKIKAWDEDRDLAQGDSEGTTDDTVIIYSDIPPKYLQLWGAM